MLVYVRSLHHLHKLSSRDLCVFRDNVEQLALLSAEVLRPSVQVEEDFYASDPRTKNEDTFISAIVEE